MASYCVTYIMFRMPNSFSYIYWSIVFLLTSFIPLLIINTIYMVRLLTLCHIGFTFKSYFVICD